MDLITPLLITLALVIAYSIGKVHGRREQIENTVETTIKSLIDRNYVRYRYNEEGEIELLEIDR